MATKLSAAKVAEGLAGLKGWKASGEDAITRQFTFKDHVAALGFVVKVATTAEVLNHHPEVNWVYNRVTLTLSTHDAGGVTKRDFDLAAKIDAVK
ncbi:MAG TPA: 4a-hydroxytetrahydrobiopterin dehydratase [Tepidiformaceae bacterium]|nr:4a-hydroxytetrahydrobiopterin dehydratase [Tepidiformaceae bacterium]HMO97177.1 4a-hydroxytetrahydrobiopterin dehydratase [Tepidiformaceae bacterium]